MVLIVYDGTFEGYLSAVFDIYELQYSEVEFARGKNYQRNIVHGSYQFPCRPFLYNELYLGNNQLHSIPIKENQF